MHYTRPMKTTLLPLVLLLAACGGDETADSAETAPATGTTARFYEGGPDAVVGELAPRDAVVEVSGDRRPGLTHQAEGSASGPQVAEGTAPERRVIRRVEDVEPQKVVPLPNDPYDENLSTLTIATDTGADGTIDRVQRSTFDGASHRILLEEDRDGDGAFEIVQAFAHYTDAKNRVVRVETDDGADGTVDSVEVRVFGDNDRVQRVEHDEDADGTPDKVEHHAWNADGRKTSWTVDEGNDGTPDMVQKWDFGPDGRSHARSLERYVDGALSRTTLYDNVYVDGKLQGTKVDLQGDGTSVNQIDRTYDDQGRIASTRSDIGGDGTVDSATRYLYDESGRLSVLEIDNGADGKADTRITRTYSGFEANDCFGR